MSRFAVLTSPQTLQKIIRIELDIILIILGFSVMIGGGDRFLTDIGPPLALTVMGIVMLGAPKAIDASISLFVLGIGLFTLFRVVGTVTLPLFRYAFGIFLITISVMNIIKHAKGGSVSKTKTFFK